MEELKALLEETNNQIKEAKAQITLINQQILTLSNMRNKIEKAIHNSTKENKLS